MASIYIRDGERYLMLYRIGSRVVSPSWCGVGGHFESAELDDPRAAALRELEEETGLTGRDIKNLRLRYVTLRLKNGEIRQNYYFFAELQTGTKVSMDCPEGILEWKGLEELETLHMPHSARGMFDHYLAYGSKDNLLYAGSSHDEGVYFHPLEEF